MKKIVGIIAALALVAGVAFADEPTYSAGSVAAFSGDASIEYQVNLNNSAFGIANAENANFKIQFYNGGSKATEGDGLWGELAISVGAGDKEVKNSDSDDSTGVFKMVRPKVDTAKIHFIEGDFSAAMNIKAPSLEIGGGDILTATWSAKAFPKASINLYDYENGAIKTEKYWDKGEEKTRNAAKKAGFTLEFGIADVAAINLQFADNGVQVAKEKKIGFTLDFALKAVENLNFVAGVGYGTEENKFIAIAKTDYKLGLTDVLYIKPAAGFALNDKDMNLSAGLLFGWGSTGIGAGFAKFNGTYTGDPVQYKDNNKDPDPDKAKGKDGSWDNVCDSTADGISVFASLPLKASPKIEFLVSAYDGTLFKGLKLGAQLWAEDITHFADKWIADAAIAFSSSELVEDWTFSANFGMELENLTANNLKKGFLWGVGVENTGIIDNTALYVKYSGQQAEDLQKSDGSIKGKNDKGTIKIGAKISF